MASTPDLSLADLDVEPQVLVSLVVAAKLQILLLRGCVKGVVECACRSWSYGARRRHPIHPAHRHLLPVGALDAELMFV